MRIFKLIITYLLLSFLCLSCDSWPSYSDVDCSHPDYSNCNGIEPFEGKLKIRVTINAENPKVPITFFIGKIEQSDVIYYDTMDTETRTYYVTINQYYSIRAEYKKNGKTIYAIDGDDVKSNYTQVCDTICWDVKNGEVDLRLK